MLKVIKWKWSKLKCQRPQIIRAVGSTWEVVRPYDVMTSTNERGVAFGADQPRPTSGRSCQLDIVKGYPSFIRARKIKPPWKLKSRISYVIIPLHCARRRRALLKKCCGHGRPSRFVSYALVVCAFRPKKCSGHGRYGRYASYATAEDTYLCITHAHTRALFSISY